MIASGQSDPGRKIPAAAEQARIRHLGHNRAGDDRPHPRHFHKAARIGIAACRLRNLLLQLALVGIQRLPVFGQQQQGAANHLGHFPRRLQPRYQLLQSLDALRRHDAKFAQRSPQRIGNHRALPHQQRTGAMKRQNRLLLHALHGHKPHRRAADRLADRLRVPPVVLVALHIRLHIGRRHQSNLMAVAADHPRPVMRAAAGLHAHRAGRKLCKKLRHGAAPQLTP